MLAKSEKVADLDGEKQLQLQLHRAIQQIASEKGISLSPQVHLVMADLVFQQTKLFGSELEYFSKHSKRATITGDDVKLLLRKQPGLMDHLASLKEEGK